MKAFIERCLSIDPKSRPSAKDAFDFCSAQLAAARQAEQGELHMLLFRVFVIGLFASSFTVCCLLFRCRRGCQRRGASVSVHVFVVTHC